MLILKKPRLDFSSIFNKYISEHPIHSYDHLPYCFDNDDDWDNFYDDEYADYLHRSFFPHGHNNVINWNSNKRKLNNYQLDFPRVKTGKKRGGNRGKHKSKSSSNKFGRYNDIDFDDYNNSSDLDIGQDAKLIYFYRDINDPDNYEEFYNLFDFDAFLRYEGIQISDYEVQKLLNRDISHCCCRNEDGELWLLSDNAYGALYYEVSDSIGGSC